MIDLDALERMTDLVDPPINGDELAALVQIARAAVAWRDACGGNAPEWFVERNELFSALRDAGL